MADIVSGHQISYRFRGPDNKPSGNKLTIYREGETAILQTETRAYGGATWNIQLGRDTCNNVVKWLEAAHAFLSLDIPTLDKVRDEGQPKGTPGVSA